MTQTHPTLAPKHIETIHHTLHDLYGDTTDTTANPNLGYTEQALQPKIFGVKRTVYERAITLLKHLIDTHPFPDGNKRTAVVATAAYLSQHDEYLQADDSIRTLVKTIATPSVIPDHAIETTLKNAVSDSPATSTLDLPSSPRDDEIEAFTRAYIAEYKPVFDQLAHE